MNKKQLIAATLIALLSVSSANATDISGVTGNNGIYNINPNQVNGDVGYRYYDQFQLSQGDIANLIFRAQNGDQRALNTFINLVGNKIDINGIVNTMRDGNFCNGHAVFVSPKGMVVGASGVLNVGTLSIVTPTDDNFKTLKNGYETKDFSVINNISVMKNGTDSNFGGNAPVDIQGKILTRGTGNNSTGIGVDIRGSQVDISGTIINGYKGNDAFTNRITAETQAAQLFNSLVNTNGSIKAATNMIADDAGHIIIKSGNDITADSKSGINITGHIANLGNAETTITNHGSNGLQIAGTVASNGKLNIYNNNTESALMISGKLTNKNADLSLSSKGGIDITKSASILTDKNLEIVNKGGQLVLAGTAISNGKTDIVNSGSQGMDISGTIGISNSTPTVRIVNENGKLVFTGGINAANSVSVRNSAEQGMEIGGSIQAGEGILVQNRAGDATLNGKLKVDNGNISVLNSGTGKLTTTSESSITNNLGNIAVKNESTGGMELNGNITNEGEIAINNLAGYAAVNGTINNTGNIGIINKANGTGLTVGGTVNNEGNIKLVNSTGIDGLTVNGTVNNTNGNLYLYNDAGLASINGTLNNTEAGNLYVLSRNNSWGIYTGADSVISNEAGNLAIKHNGDRAAAPTGGVGMNLNGSISNDGEIAINNYSGQMLVNGTITQNGNATIGIINRSASEDKANTAIGGINMEVNATINGRDINIKNNGKGDLTVNGEITHNGRLNILGNEGNLTLGGTIHNTGSDITYAASRANGNGIDVKSTFNADANNGGTILIKNISGANGLTYDGTITSTKQAELYNKVGDLTVTGAINAVPAVILNTGKGLTVTDAANLQGDVKIVNKGTEKAVVADKYKNNFREAVK